MRRLTLPLEILILCCLAGYFAYFVHEQVIPCVTPLRFALTSYDSRFGLPEAAVKADLDRAAQMWNSQLGFDALEDVGSSTPSLPVSFVYDSTQQEVNSISALGDDIDTLKAQLTSIANQYASLKAQYDADNAQGKATQAQYDQLTGLYKQYEALRQKINADVSEGNDLPQGSVEEGLYTSDASGTRIQIFAFESEPELLRTMAHEFGHALGLNHVANPDSIMYPTNGATEVLALTQEDIAELDRACSENKSSLLGVLYIHSQKILDIFFARS